MIYLLNIVKTPDNQEHVFITKVSFPEPPKIIGIITTNGLQNSSSSADVEISRLINKLAGNSNNQVQSYLLSKKTFFAMQRQANLQQSDSNDDDNIHQAPLKIYELSEQNFKNFLNQLLADSIDSTEANPLKCYITAHTLEWLNQLKADRVIVYLDFSQVKLLTLQYSQDELDEFAFLKQYQYIKKLLATNPVAIQKQDKNNLYNIIDKIVDAKVQIADLKMLLSPNQQIPEANGSNEFIREELSELKAKLKDLRLSIVEFYNGLLHHLDLGQSL